MKRDPSITVRKLDALIGEFSDPAFPDDKTRLSGLRKTLEEAMLAANLMEHDAVKRLINEFMNDVRAMTEILIVKKSDELTDRQRDNIIDRRELYRNFLAFFIDADRAIGDIEKQVDEEVRYFEFSQGKGIQWDKAAEEKMI